MALVVSNYAFSEPLAETISKEVVAEIFAPQTTVADTGFGHRAIQIQHSDQSWPCTAPVGHRQDRAAMSEQSVEQMMAVLPNTLSHNQGSIRVEFSEYFHAHFLRIDEPVLLDLVKTVRALNCPAFCFQGLSENSFHFGLFRPAFLVG